MTPYYEDDAVTIYHGDCREILPTLEADVLVTDPPYGMGYVSNFGYDATQPIKGDHDTTLRDEILHYWGDRPALVFGTWRKPRPTATRELLVWHKTGVGFLGDLSLPWGPSHEEIYVLGKGWEGRRRSNVYAVDGLSAGSFKRPDHPTPKPVPLLQALIARASSPIRSWAQGQRYGQRKTSGGERSASRSRNGTARPRSLGWHRRY
jgi:site-specific DNA-methyltransferase (adenine-specific)